MGLALLTFRNLVNSKFLLLVVILSLQNQAWAQCQSSDLALENAKGLFQRGQYLLAHQEFSIAEKFNCAKNIDASLWGQLLSVTQLGEHDEMFYRSHDVYPNKFSPTYQEKLKVYKHYYFPKNDGSDIAKRVEAFSEWKENLPKAKSPALAGTMSAILPGSGQVYTGAWQSGIMAFVLNALFLSTTLELEDKDLHSTALASGVLFSITYLGNILNAAESARVYNRNSSASQIELEKKRQFPELEL